MSKHYTIWYMTPEHFPQGIMGKLPAQDMSTHRSLGTMACTFEEPTNEISLLRHLQIIFSDYQAEPGSPVWPLDESGLRSTKLWLDSIGIEHTSMSVGDVIESDGRWWMVNWVGFKELKPPEWTYDASGAKRYEDQLRLKALGAENMDSLWGLPEGVIVVDPNDPQEMHEAIKKAVE